MMTGDDPILRARTSLISNGINLEYHYKLSMMWDEPHRFYHSKAHLSDILDLIEADQRTTPEQKSQLMTIAVYHDCHYNPLRTDNEEQSAQEYKKDTVSFNHDIYDSILDTKDHASFASNALSEYFLMYDLHNLLHGSLPALIKDSDLLSKEFGFLDWSAMKAGRIAFIERIMPFIKRKSSDTHIEEYLDWLCAYTPKIAAFAGSFFPIHRGHLDILKKAERIFDKVILACGQNPSKPYTAEQITENVAAIRKVLPSTQVEFFPGFLTDYIESKPYPLTVVKGLRNPSDFDNEKLLLRWMEDLKPDIDIVYVMSDRQYEHVSSSGVKLIQLTQKLSGDEKDLTSKYLPNTNS